MAPNRYAGTCKCGQHVGARLGFVQRVRGRWVVRCESCAAEDRAAERAEDAAADTEFGRRLAAESYSEQRWDR